MARYPPLELIEDAPVLSCAVSSHLFIACVSVLTYHASSARFIRALAFSAAVGHLLINTMLQIIVGDNFIEVFTVNGTHVALALSINDVSVFIATGHASGSIRLWEIDPGGQQSTSGWGRSSQSTD
jgi:hypothetical protein